MPELEQAIDDAHTLHGAREIIVCGHEGCRKLAAVFDPHTAITDLALAVWLDHAEAVARAGKTRPSESRLSWAVEFNVAQQLLRLRTYPAVAAGQIRLLEWVYDPTLDIVTIPDPRVGRRRAALDPAHNFLFRRERIHSQKNKPPAHDLPSIYLA